MCVCEREKSCTFGEIHTFPSKMLFPNWCKGMPNWMAGGGVGSILNVGLDLSLKGKQNEKEK